MADTKSSVRLNKYLALQLGISRREADEHIEHGEVTVNDIVAHLGAQVTPSDKIHVRGKPVSQDKSEFIYLALHKPEGYVCSRRQQGDNPTIYSLIPQRYHSLKLVGRLDKDSSGLILLTNDGDFAFQMTHPKFYKVKVYEAKLDHELAPLHQQMISDHGVILDDGPSKFELERMSEDNRLNWRVTMHEGRNRQIRRTFSSLGYTVTMLHRTHFGPYSLNGLAPEKFAIVDKK